MYGMYVYHNNNFQFKELIYIENDVVCSGIVFSFIMA